MRRTSRGKTFVMCSCLVSRALLGHLHRLEQPSRVSRKSDGLRWDFGVPHGALTLLEPMPRLAYFKLKARFL